MTSPLKLFELQIMKEIKSVASVKRVLFDSPKLRICIFSAALMALVTSAITLLPQDFTLDSDPKVQEYQHVKFRLVTFCFNIINLTIYYPLSIYCNWEEHRNGGNSKYMKKYLYYRDLLFSTYLFPTVMCADTAFWLLYRKDRELIAPAAVFSYIRDFDQHLLHTASLVVTVLDLVLTPRKTPSNVLPRLGLMTVLYVAYIFMIGESFSKGIYVYNLLDGMSILQVTVISIFFYIIMVLCFMTQWKVIDYIWGKQKQKQ